jgi:hypothetical protein
MEESFESLPFMDDAGFVCRRFAFGRAGPVFLFGVFAGTGVCSSAIVNAPHHLPLMTVERRINAHLQSRDGLGLCSTRKLHYATSNSLYQFARII